MLAKKEMGGYCGRSEVVGSHLFLTLALSLGKTLDIYVLWLIGSYWTSLCSRFSPLHVFMFTFVILLGLQCNVARGVHVAGQVG